MWKKSHGEGYCIDVGISPVRFDLSKYSDRMLVKPNPKCESLGCNEAVAPCILWIDEIEKGRGWWNGN